MPNEEKFPTARQTRIALIVLVPLALVVGPRAVAWAELQYQNTWKSGDKLTAADLNARFDAIKTAVDGLQQGGYVGSVLISGNGCGYSAQLGSASPFLFTTLSAGTGCTTTVVDGTFTGAKLAVDEEAVTAGKPLSFKLSGPPGHYEVIATGYFYAFNGNLDASAASITVATRWFDGSTGKTGGFSINGQIDGGVAASTRYSNWGESNAGFTYPAAFSTTISFQAANNNSTTKTSAGAQPSNDPAGPLEIRVYKR